MRYERKFRIENMGLAAVQQLLWLHPASLRKLYPDRQINNIYLDTPELRTWNDNLFGVNQRKKYRIRWYGDDLHNIGSPKLELKIKHNELGTKQSFLLEDFTLPELTERVSQLAEQHPALPLLTPALLNTYRRSYYQTYDRRFRLTIDREMCFYSLRDMAVSPLQAVRDAALILEVKYERKNDDLVEQITQHLPFRQSRHSKYVMGISLTG